ncbi:MAG: sulfurtransferase [Proteobacteria bacterium]|nr:sulfurtransferase [Pseudomonadota bacterium]MCP4920238.1 sulfurtransferase [Pseudomonadota bacterium]
MRIAELTPQDVAERLERGEKLVLLDCREAFELSLAALEGVVHIPLAHLADRADELEPEAPTVVLCHHGVRSRAGAAILLSEGFAEVWSMRGGIDLWARTVDPGVGTY